MSLTDIPALAVVEDAAPLVEWAVKMLESIPDLTRRFSIQCANVADLTGLCGLVIARKSLLGLAGCTGLKVDVRDSYTLTHSQGHNNLSWGKLAWKEDLRFFPTRTDLVSFGRLNSVPSRWNLLNLRSLPANSEPRSAEVRARRTTNVSESCLRDSDSLY